jgi:hypothetical protein
MIEIRPSDWPPKGTWAKCDRRDGVEWDGPLFEVTESWLVIEGKREHIVLRGTILEPHDWPAGEGMPFTCCAPDVSYPDGEPPS